MPAVHRHGDLRSCGSVTIATGQATVFANFKPVSVTGDLNSHGGGATLSTNNPGTVFAGFKPVTMQGSLATRDPRKHHTGPATKTATGSPDVFAG